MISSPTTGSAQSQPSATPPTPSSTASEVNPSVRACSPSATRAAEPILRPTRIRYRATSSLPVNPTSAARATAIRLDTGRGWASLVIASTAASADEAAMISTIDHPGQVLGPAVPVGVAAVGRPPADRNAIPSGTRGERVGRVVQRVAQQRDRAGERDHDRLDQRGAAEHGQGDPQRPDPLGAGLHGRVDLVGRLVRVRAQQVPQPGQHAGPVIVIVLVAMLMAGLVMITIRGVIVAISRAVPMGAVLVAVVLRIVIMGVTALISVVMPVVMIVVARHPVAGRSYSQHLSFCARSPPACWPRRCWGRSWGHAPCTDPDPACGLADAGTGSPASRPSWRCPSPSRGRNSWSITRRWPATSTLACSSPSTARSISGYLLGFRHLDVLRQRAGRLGGGNLESGAMPAGSASARR